MNRKNVIIIVLAVLLAALLAGGGVYLWKSGDDENTDASASDQSVQTDEAAVATDAVVNMVESEIVGETLPTISDEDAIKQAMADKYSKDISEVDLSVGEIDGDYAKGVVIFAGDVSGGWWLAAKDSGGQWVIVADGNGVILCSAIAPYDFPVSMVPECYDDATDTLITR